MSCCYQGCPQAEKAPGYLAAKGKLKRQPPSFTYLNAKGNCLNPSPSKSIISKRMLANILLCLSKLQNPSALNSSLNLIISQDRRSRSWSHQNFWAKGWLQAAFLLPQTVSLLAIVNNSMKLDHPLLENSLEKPWDHLIYKKRKLQSSR